MFNIVHEWFSSINYNFHVCNVQVTYSYLHLQGNKIRRRGDWMVWISSNGSSRSKSPTPHEQVSIMKNPRLDGDSKAEPEAAAADIHLNNIPIDAHEEMNIGTT